MATYNLGKVVGPQGPQGEPGATGPAGTAASVSIGTVITGTNAAVTNSGTASAAVFDFVIPKGDKGDPGDPGTATAADVAYTDTNNKFEAADNVNTVQKAIDKLAEGGIGGANIPMNTLTVKFLDENSIEHMGSTIQVISGGMYDVSDTVPPTGYVLDGLASGSAAITGAMTSDKTVIFNICVDNWNSTNNTLTGGDEIADKYEVVFNYVSGGDGTVTGTTTKVVSLGVGNSSGTVTPGVDGITLTPNTLFKFKKWDIDPTEPMNVTGGQTYTFTAQFSNYEKYSFYVDTTKSVPTEMIVYPGSDCDNVNYTPAGLNTNNVFSYGDWGNAFFIQNTKPCMLKYDGTVDYYLNKNNYNQKEDGTAHSNLNNTSYGGNVMIEFPQIWICVSELAEDGASETKPRIFVSDMDISDSTHTYHAYAHTDFNGNLIDKIYMPAYEGCNVNNVLRSLSGQTVMVSQTGITERIYAQKNNPSKSTITAVTQDPVSWDMSPLCDHELLMILCLLISKSTDNQTAFGRGLCSMSAATKTGGNSSISDTSGFFYGTNANGTTPVKIFGIENPWGNVWMRKTGCVRDASKNLRIKMTPPYLTDPASETTLLATYENIGLYSGGDGYVKGCVFNEYGIFPAVGGGSETTYYCDYQYGTGSANTFALFGGDWGYGSRCGLFYWSLADAVSHAGPSIGSSVSCKPLAA